ncbi:MAG: DUF1850 domain-containing protein [Negativicutes bacterium]|nr:DUF1850 domain-containing protein [Negativicutes bacterium]
MKGKMRYKLAGIFLVVIFAALGWNVARQPYLVIEADKAVVYKTLPIQVGSYISLSFTHSVQKTPVIENFVINESYRLVLKSTEYKSLGVGLPFLAEDGVFFAGDNKFVMSGMDRVYPGIDLRVGPEAQHSLIYGDSNIPLHDLFPPGTLVHLRVVPYYKVWFGATL